VILRKHPISAVVSKWCLKLTAAAKNCAELIRLCLCSSSSVGRSRFARGRRRAPLAADSRLDLVGHLHSIACFLELLSRLPVVALCCSLFDHPLLLRAGRAGEPTEYSFADLLALTRLIKLAVKTCTQAGTARCMA
jgi:hypothetical protein